MAELLKKKIDEKKKILSDYITNGTDEIGKANLHVLRVISNLIFLLAFLFCHLTPILLQKWKMTRYHAILLVITMLFAIIAEIMTRKKIYGKKPVTAVVVCFMLSLIIIFIILDTILYPFASETFVILFLVTAPILFIVPFEPMLFFQILFVTGFLITAKIYKDPAIFAQDAFQTILGGIFGVNIYFIVMRLRLQEYRQKSLYKMTSERDPLTQINNRASSKSKIDMYLETKWKENACAMIVLDVDNFKKVNDTLGHEKGDEVLQAVARILQNIFRNGDIIGRFGGDEFIVFLKDISDEKILGEKCEQINEKMKDILNGRYKISCSMGVCYVAEGDALQEEMFHVADEALYEAKAFGRATYVQHEYEARERENKELPLMVIVDDVLVEREILAIQFEDKYRLKLIDNAVDAMHYIQENAGLISVILLDMIMPGENGFDLLNAIKKQPDVAWIPVIAVSSNPDNEAEALKCGAADMIVKPIEPAVMKLRVANVMKNQKR